MHNDELFFNTEAPELDVFRTVPSVSYPGCRAWNEPLNLKSKKNQPPIQPNPCERYCILSYWMSWRL